VVFTDFSAEDVVSIRIVNSKDDGYTIYSKSCIFSITEIDERGQAVPYNQALLLGAVTAVSSLSAHTVAEENAEDLDKYGLVNPAIEVTAVFSTGDTVTFFVGDPAPDGTSLYFRLKDSNDVYAVSSHMVNPFFSERHDFIERLAFPQYNAALTPTVDRVMIKRPDLDEPIIIESIPELALEDIRTFNAHKLTSPLSIDADSDKSANVIFGIFGLTAANVLWVAPEEYDFEKTGLSSPLCTVEVQAGQEVYTLILGGDFQGGVYGMSSHAPELLLLFDRAVLPWLTVTANDLVSDIFLTPYIYSLSKLEIVTNARTLSFDSDSFADERLKLLYQYMISARGEELFKETDISDGYSKPIAIITFYYLDESRPPDVVKYGTARNRRSVIQVNDVNLFTCREVYTTRLIENIEAFIDGGEIILDW
jgi:hypothetical protein